MALLAAVATLAVIPLGLARPQDGSRVGVLFAASMLVGMLVGSLGSMVWSDLALVSVGAFVAELWTRQLIAPAYDTAAGDLFVQATSAIGAIFLGLALLVGHTVGRQLQRLKVER